MKNLSLVLAASLCAGISAQNTLTVDPGAFDPMAVGLTYSNPGANFFDLVVQNVAGITLRAMEIPTQEPGGTTGTIELWINRNSATHVGTEMLAAAPTTSGDPSGWELLTSGAYTSAGFAVSARTCQSAFTVNVPDTFLVPGTYPIAIVYVDVAHQFDGVTVYPPPAGTFTDGNIEVQNGTTQSVAWTAAPLNAFTFGNPPVNYLGTIPDIGVTYDVGPVAHACAEAELVGVGSGGQVGSFFDLIEDSANVQTALEGNSLLLTNIGTGYLVSQGTATFRPNSGNETALIAVDDGEEQITIPNLPVPYPTELGGATTTDLWVHSNGYVSFTGAQSALFFVPVDPQAAMDADQTCLYGHYHDYNSTEAGSGLVIWEEDLAASPNPTLYITWDNVEGYPTTIANPSRVQYQIDLVTGNIEVVYDLIDGVGGSTFAGGDDTLVGWSPAGVSPTVVESDFTTLGASGAGTNLSLILPENLPLTLTPSAIPTSGTPVDLTVSNIQPQYPIALVVLDTTLVNPPTPLFPLGAPMDTTVYIANLTIVFDVTALSPVLTVPIPAGASAVGAELIAQAFTPDIPQVLAGNVFGNLQSSNAVRLLVGNL